MTDTPRETTLADIRNRLAKPLPTGLSSGSTTRDLLWLLAECDTLRAQLAAHEGEIATLTKEKAAAEAVWQGLVNITSCTSPEGLAELDQVRYAYERATAAEARADTAEAHLRVQRQRVEWLEGTAMPHARRQENANGFQKGWHAALARVSEGDNTDALSTLVPQPCADVDDTLPLPAPPITKESQPHE